MDVMRWLDREKGVRRWNGFAAVLLGIGVVAGSARPTLAQIPYAALDSSALAIAAFEASRNQCRYSAKLGKALAEIDVFLAREAGAAWAASKQAAPQKLVALRNASRVLGTQSDCSGYGAAIGVVMPVYFRAAELDPEVLEEFGRLAHSGGRSISGEAEARPPQPPPGSAAAIISEMDQQEPYVNRSANTGGGVSDLRRLPADDDRGLGTASPPAMRSPAATASRGGADPSASAGVAAPLRPLSQTEPSPVPLDIPVSPPQRAPSSGAAGATAVVPSGDSEAKRSMGASRIAVPIVIGGSEKFDACTGAGHVVGLDPRGDGFLSVRSGPGSKSFAELDRLYNGNTVTICVQRGPWMGVVYGPRAMDCNTGTPWLMRMPYTGPCRAGWIHSRYVMVTAG